MLIQQKGDTIVEVMFAVAVAGLTIVLSLAVMNRGVATTQMAVENTLVRQSLDGQAESLRFLRDTNSPQWTNIVESRTGSSATPFEDNDNCAPTTLNRAFYVEVNVSDGPNSGSAVVKNYSDAGDSTEIFAQPGNGMWIEAVKSSPTQQFIDFHIQACWAPPFSGPNARTGSIVRLYE